MKIAFALLTMMIGWTAHATPSFEIAKINGKLVHMNQEQANLYCLNRGGHLPTSRELAEYAVTRGAKIRETAHRGVRHIDAKVTAEIQKAYRDGYEPVLRRVSADITEVEFYLNTRTYKRPTYGTDLANWFWTSSKWLDAGFGYAFSGYTGTITNNGLTLRPLAVMCVLK